MSKRKHSYDGRASEKCKTKTIVTKDQVSDVVRQQKTKEKELITWPESDILKLIDKIKKKIPSDDNVSYGCRMEKLDWGDIPFKSYSVEECKEVWSILLKKVRKFRLLQEVVTDMKTWVESPKAYTTKNHPDKPKLPLNSFMLFVKKNRQLVINKDPYLTPTEVSRKLGTMFKELPMKTRDKYEQKAKAAREVYLEKLKNFYKEHPNQIPQKRNRLKSLVFGDGEGPPQKPKTPFQLFVQVEIDKTHTENKEQQNFREIWIEKSDKEKYFWIKWSQEQYNEYMKQLKNYLKIHPDYEPGKIKVLSKKEKEIRDLYLGKPEKPPHSAYHLFTKMIMETDDIRTINHKEAITYISEKWKACPEEEKNEYKTRIEQMWEEYYRKMNEFIMSLPPEERGQVKVQNVKKLAAFKKKQNTTANKVSKEKLKPPKQPPLTKYKYFLSVYKGKENPFVIWKHMTDEEKQEYNQNFAALRKKYIMDYQAYLKSLSKDELQALKAGSHQIEESSDSESSALEEEF